MRKLNYLDQVQVLTLPINNKISAFQIGFHNAEIHALDSQGVLPLCLI